MSLTEGSSPRMRGKHITPEPVKRGTGLIPAHAGKTKAWALTKNASTAHPRACGENKTWHGVREPPTGSSPRMRGKLDRPVSFGVECGLIPAHAGKTCGCIGLVLLSRAHPRACGENVNGIKIAATAVGSSPRMRGKPSPGRTWFKGTRLIPAHAGKT